MCQSFVDVNQIKLAVLPLAILWKCLSSVSQVRGGVNGQLFSLSNRASSNTVSEGISQRGSSEIAYRFFTSLPDDVYYWVLPESFRGDKVRGREAAGYSFPFVSCSDLPQHVVGWRGSTHPHGLEFTVMCVLWLLSQQDGVKCLRTIQLLNWRFLLLAGDRLRRGASLHRPLWAVPALAEHRQCAGCDSPRKRHPPGILLSD